MEEDDDGPMKKMYMHVGGEWALIRSGALAYVNGKKVYTGQYDLDYFDWKGIWDMYRIAGGKGTGVTFYYKHPCLPMTDEHAVRHIWGNWSFVEIQNTHRIASEVMLYSVRDDESIHAAFDVDGSLFPLSQERDGEEPETIKYLTFPGWPPPQQEQEPDIEPVVTQNAEINEPESSTRRRRTTEEVMGLLTQSQDEPDLTHEQELVQPSNLNETCNMNDSEEGVQPSNLNDEVVQKANLNESCSQNEECLQPSNLNDAHDHVQTTLLNEEALHTSNLNKPSSVDDDHYAFLDEQFNLNLGEVLSFQEDNEQAHEPEEDAVHEEPVCRRKKKQFSTSKNKEKKKQSNAQKDKGKEKPSKSSRKRQNVTAPDPEDSPLPDGSEISSDPSDSEDEDYIEELDFYDDIEDSSDDDIFAPRDRSRAAKKAKLQKMRQRAKEKKKQVISDEEMEVEHENWYSEPDDDRNFDEPPLSDDEGKKRYPHWRDGDYIKKFKPSVGYTFDNVESYKKVLIDWSIWKGYVLDFQKSERMRVTAVCASENCNWRVHASCIQQKEEFQIKTLKGRHNCARSSDNFRCSSSYIGEKLLHYIKDNMDIGVEPFRRVIRRKLGVEVTYNVALHAKRFARDLIEGDHGKEFELLWDYCETVRDKNPGSKLLLKKEEGTNPPRFQKMFFSLKPMIDGFLQGCRPLIGLDGCFIKTVFGGQLLTAVAKDGNDNLYPIAMAYVRVENRENWVWFLEELMLEIGGLGEDKWTFISDRQKGLLDAVNQVCPGSEHRFCLRHLYQNFFTKWKSQDLKRLFWRAASAGSKEEWSSVMKELEKASTGHSLQTQTPFEWLSSIPPEHWARSHFRTTCKSEILVNNICESFNNMILAARDLPVISMFECIRNRLMQRIQTKK